MATYEETVSKIECKPFLNLKWYRNDDLYSDGDIEDLIIELLAYNSPEEYVDAIYANFSWATFYHLTHIRQNLLNWYPFSSDSDVLEIGCGFGAITSLLCDRCRSVTAVELSKRRASGAMLRCRNKANLEIIVGNLNDIEFDKKFDYITLIGVLEYQGCFTATSNPFTDFLRKIRSLLKPDGKLLIAIENQYGLKYWCGAKEDHTCIPFEGMNQYRISGENVRTFSKSRLESMIKDSGFSSSYFYYPLPDYKLPKVIFSQDVLPKNESLEGMVCYYIPDKSSLVAKEDNLYKDIIDNNVFEFFANSFLVECSDSDDIGNVTFAKLSVERPSEYQIGTRFTKSGTVEKFSLKEKGRQHLKNILENEQRLIQHGLNILQSELINGSLVTEFSSLTSVQEHILQYIKARNFDDFYIMIDRIYEDILKSSEEANWKDNIIYKFFPDIAPDKDKFGSILKIGYLDMLPSNAFFDNKTIYWFDQEWILENVPAKFILYRCINYLYVFFPKLRDILPADEVATRYKLDSVWENMSALENLFSKVSLDEKVVAELGFFSGNDHDNCTSNIKKLLRRD